MTAVRLQLELQLRPATAPAGTAVLTNAGDGTLRIWRDGNSWSEGSLSFLVSPSGGGDARAITRVAQVYTRNAAAPLDIPAGGSHALAFDLGDATWEPDAALALLGEPGAQLAAAFAIEPTPESAALAVWTGRVQSAFVALG